MTPDGPQHVVETGATQVVVQTPSDAVTKGDLEVAKNDLRREMKLWLGAGSALGTALSGLLAARLGSGQAIQQIESLARATGLL